jgi:hypothetical protein
VILEDVSNAFGDNVSTPPPEGLQEEPPEEPPEELAPSVPPVDELLQTTKTEKT